MNDPTPHRPPQFPARGAIVAAGLSALALWAGLWLLALRPDHATALDIAAALVPPCLVAVAIWLALQLRALAADAAALRSELAALRQRAARESRDRAARPSGQQADSPPPDNAMPDPAMPVPAAPEPAAPEATPAGATPPETGASADAQPSLPLAPPQSDPPAPLSLPDLIRALHFPETEDDRQGLRALARALRHHKAGLVVQAAQDMLTLLSQDGIYVDDLAPPDIAATTWRHFADGARDADIAGLGDLGPGAPVDKCREKLQANTVYRDAAHHFLRRFDQLLADMVPQMSDDAVAALTATRSARAFRLIGAASGMFDKG